MSRRLGALLLVCLTGITAAEAQIVRVGPLGGVRVRAPFVAVDVLPYGGGTRVRAPFTAVDTGLYQFDAGMPYYVPHAHALHYAVPVYPVAPIYPVPVYPALVHPELVYPEIVYPEPAYVAPPEHQMARPVNGSLPERLRAAAMRLSRSLSLRRDDGDVWQNYLAPQSIVDVIDQGMDPQSLRELLRNYDGVVANPALTSIRHASGFNETRQLLRQYVGEPAPVEMEQPEVERPEVGRRPVSVPVRL